MKVLITGASSGIGMSFAKAYAKKGYEVIAVGRNIDRLSNLQKQINCIIEVNDISITENCYNLYEKYKDIDILINNAGFGDNGLFFETDIKREMNLIDTNVKATQILTKLYLQQMMKKNQGTILNLGSIAAFLPGPLMASYYASKAYVLSLTRSIAKELKKEKSKVQISILCPGPVKTNFFDTANCNSIKPKITSDYIVRYALKKMRKKKVVIIPTFSMKLSRCLAKFLPYKLVSNIVYKIQKNRTQE